MLLVDKQTKKYGKAKYWSNEGTLTNFCNLQSGFIVQFEEVTFPNHEKYKISEDTEVCFQVKSEK